ncbi:MAG TPA: tetratricopeptide repeat protein, partial [Xanthomonadales bacterium]|nr:tetratricopeptide repeat protein [Xanthomonadales bacterium]
IKRVLQRAGSGLNKRTTSVPKSTRRVDPAVAVLPFTNRSDNPDDEYLADGITEDIITRLQRFRTFPIIPRHSVFGYKGKPFNLPEIARQLDVAYLVVGQTRNFSDRIRISIDLIETRDFHSVYSENFDREIEDIFDLQDEISIIIAAKLQPEIERSEREQDLPSHTESIASWHLVRRGAWHQYKLTREDAVEARRYFELALEQNPNSVEALVNMGWWYWWDLSVRRGRREDWAVVKDYALRASVIDPKDARPHLQIGIATMMGGNPKAAIKIFEEAIRLNPCFAVAYASLGSAYEVTGEPGKALRALDKAIKLSPFDYNIFHAQGERACAFYSAREFEQAIDAAELSLNLRPGYWLAHLVKTAALARAGRIDEAKVALESLLRFRKNFGLRDIEWIGYTDPGRVEEMVEALQLAGWQPDTRQDSGV